MNTEEKTAFVPDDLEKLGESLQQLLPDLPFLEDTFRLLFEVDSVLEPQLHALARRLRETPLS